MFEYPKIKSSVNPYQLQVQGKANEPICVAGFLDEARKYLGEASSPVDIEWSLKEIVERLDQNYPRIAIIGGSADHPAHIRDLSTAYRAALRIWQNGGVPFYFATPVMCDGTAQSTQGMSYSLQSRNAIAEIVVNQIEAHSYHGAFVLQSCDKQPLALVGALAHIDRLRQSRGEAPFFATFAPAHVLRGGVIPQDVREELNKIAAQAISGGASDIADDIRDTMEYILQCSSNTTFQGVLSRAVDRGLIDRTVQKDLEKRIAAATCHCDGGICAFNGTGNSSRTVVCALGLVHPTLEFLTAPPSQEQVNVAVDDLGRLINNTTFGVANIMATNIKNAIRIHSASGGSTNLTMHIVAAMLYGGYTFGLTDFAAIHEECSVPDLFNYSLTEGRDFFALAEQCSTGQIRGVETIYYELLRNGVTMDEDAPTVTGTSWRTRLKHKRNLAATSVVENPIIMSKPRRAFSGVDVLQGNFFDDAVVKISGMPTAQLDHFDQKLAFVLYFENEDAANRSLLNPDLIQDLQKSRKFDKLAMLALLRHNHPKTALHLESADYDSVFTGLLATNALRIAIVIAGQGPMAFGMPEMFTPMQYINGNRQLKQVATVISDGRYSGVTYGAAIGHLNPEAKARGGILYLQTGDILYLQLREKRIDFVDTASLLKGNLELEFAQIPPRRKELGEERLATINKRQRLIAASNRMNGCTASSLGVVPQTVYEEAYLNYQKDVIFCLNQEQHRAG